MTMTIMAAPQSQVLFSLESCDWTKSPGCYLQNKALDRGCRRPVFLPHKIPSYIVSAFFGFDIPLAVKIIIMLLNVKSKKKPQI